MIVLRYSFLIGLAGFLLGFVGPILLAPEANQGPLLGIFITGPLGAIVGAIMGLWFRRRSKHEPRYRDPLHRPTGNRG